MKNIPALYSGKSGAIVGSESNSEALWQRWYRLSVSQTPPRGGRWVRSRTLITSTWFSSLGWRYTAVLLLEDITQQHQRRAGDHGERESEFRCVDAACWLDSECNDPSQCAEAGCGKPTARLIREHRTYEIERYRFPRPTLENKANKLMFQKWQPISCSSDLPGKERCVLWIMFTFGYGYCFPLGYVMPVNRGKAMLGTRLSLRTRKANLSPSGDHQWATWVPRISSVLGGKKGWARYFNQPWKVKDRARFIVS